MNNLKGILSIFLLVLTLLNFISCNKEDTGSGDKIIPFRRIPQDVKDFCYFKEYSYWIYQDSLSGAYDTIEVIGSTLDTINYFRNGKLVQTNELFDIEMRTTFDGYFTNIYKTTPTPPENDNNWVFIDRYISGNVKGSSFFHLFPYKLEQRIGGSYDTMFLIQNDPDLKIYEHYQHPCYDDAHIVEWQEKNVGVTRREIKNRFNGKSYVWKLIDHQVYQ